MRVTKVEKQPIRGQYPDNVTRNSQSEKQSSVKEAPSPGAKSSLNVSKVPAPASVVNVTKVAATPPAKGTTISKAGWQNQVSFSPTGKRNSPAKSDFDALLAAKDTKPSAPSSHQAVTAVTAVTAPPKSIYNSVNNKKTSSSEASNASKDSVDRRHSSSSGLSAVTSASQTTPKQPQVAVSSAPATPMFSTPSPQVSMFQHDPKNILAAVTTMSSILGSAAPFFAQKLQQKTPGVTESPSLSPGNHSSSSQSSKPDLASPSSVKNTQSSYSSVKNSQSSYSSPSFKASPATSMKDQSPLNLSTLPSPGASKQPPVQVTSQQPPGHLTSQTSSYAPQQKQINQNSPRQSPAAPVSSRVPEKSVASSTSVGQTAKLIPAQSQVQSVNIFLFSFL